MHKGEKNIQLKEPQPNCCISILLVFFFLFFLIPKWKKNKIYFSLSDFILHTFKKFKLKFYHSTEGHTFSFLALLYKACPVDYW